MTGVRSAAALLVVVLMLVPMPATGARQGDAGVLELTLGRAIRLALHNSRFLLVARHGRVTDRFELEVAEDRYRPTASVGVSASDGNRRSESAEISAGPRLRVPTGGAFNLRWSEPLAGRNVAGSWTLGFSQPLLKGFGPGIDSAPLRIARIRERMNDLSFRQTVATIVESVIPAYRLVIQAHRALAISRDSLARSKKQLAINRSLIRVGRLAEREIVQTEAEIAVRELALAESRNRLHSATVDLVSILDVDAATRIIPMDTTLTVEALHPDPQQSIATAFAVRTDYRRAQLNKEIAAIEVRLTENDTRWDLRLTANVSRGGAEGRDYGVALGLMVPLGDRRDELWLLRAKNRLRNAEIALVELRQSIRIEVRQAVREVEVGLRRIELSRKARELAEKQLEVERRKLALGLTSAYQLTAVEDDVIGAQNAELDAIVSYLNAGASLDRALGTTLRTWEIDVEEVESGSGRLESAEVSQRIDPQEHRLVASFTPVEQIGEATVGQEDRPGPPPPVVPVAEPSPAAARVGGGARSRAGSPAPARRSLLLSLDDFESVATVRRADTDGAISHQGEPPVWPGKVRTVRSPTSPVGNRPAAEAVTSLRSRSWRE